MVSKIINGKEYLFVELPEVIIGEPYINGFGTHICFQEQHEPTPTCIYFLREGVYEVIGKASELTEKEWEGIVRELPVGNRYENYNGDYPIWFYSAKDSGKSILKNNGLHPETALIIQKR